MEPCVLGYWYYHEKSFSLCRKMSDWDGNTGCLENSEINIDNNTFPPILVSTGRQEVVPTEVNILTARTCEYVTFHGRRVFADVIKAKTLNSGDYWNGEPFPEGQKEIWGRTKKDQRAAVFEDEEVGPWPKKCRHPVKDGKGKEMVSPTEAPERNSSWQYLDVSLEDPHWSCNL